MRHAIIIAGLLVGSFTAAQASSHYETSYRDLVRPNGQPRSEAVYDAALDFCYARTGLSRTAADTRAFKDCMRGRGYRWLVTKEVRDAPSEAEDDRYIDQYTGMSCKDYGGIAVCVPPQGTVHYHNRHGLNCTRTGLVAVCTNLGE